MSPSPATPKLGDSDSYMPSSPNVLNFYQESKDSLKKDRTPTNETSRPRQRLRKKHGVAQRQVTQALEVFLRTIIYQPS